MSVRDKLRSKTVGAPKNFKSTTVEIDGEEFEIRQPSVKERMDIFNHSSKDGGVNALDFQLWSVIRTCYVPGTNERVFEDSDYSVLADQPAGSFLDKLGEAAMTMLNLEEKPTSDSKGTATK